jgi:hypothetical protein
MSATKKTTAKSTKSSTPANKETKSAAKPAAKKSAPKAVTKSEAATAAIVAAVTRVAAPVIAATATVKPVASKPVTTTITAKIDIGFGNILFVRGEGAGLSWDQGIPMTNVGRDAWQLALGESSRPLAFKFLINDVTWSTGADFTLAPGSTGTFTPTF